MAKKLEIQIPDKQKTPKRARKKSSPANVRVRARAEDILARVQEKVPHVNGGWTGNGRHFHFSVDQFSFTSISVFELDGSPHPNRCSRLAESVVEAYREAATSEDSGTPNPYLPMPSTVALPEASDSVLRSRGTQSLEERAMGICAEIEASTGMPTDAEWSEWPDRSCLVFRMEKAGPYHLRSETFEVSTNKEIVEKVTRAWRNARETCGFVGSILGEPVITWWSDKLEAFVFAKAHEAAKVFSEIGESVLDSADFCPTLTADLVVKDFRSWQANLKLQARAKVRTLALNYTATAEELLAAMKAMRKRNGKGKRFFPVGESIGAPSPEEMRGYAQKSPGEYTLVFWDAMSAEPYGAVSKLGNVPGVGISARPRVDVLPFGHGWDDLPDATPEEIRAFNAREAGRER